MVPIPETTPNDVVPAFRHVLNTSIKLESGFSLKVSTWVADEFKVVAMGQYWDHCDCPTV